MTNRIAIGTRDEGRGLNEGQGVAQVERIGPVPLVSNEIMTSWLSVTTARQVTGKTRTNRRVGCSTTIVALGPFRHLPDPTPSKCSRGSSSSVAR